MRVERMSTNAKAADARLEEILDRLEAQEREAGANRERRWPYRQSAVSVTIEHPGGGSAKFATNPISLWCEGVTFLFPGFAYPGSSCAVLLSSKCGESMLARGTVVACRHVDGVLHVAEVKFSKRVDPHLFVERPAAGAPDATGQVELTHLHGNVLYVDDSEFDPRLLAHHLRGSGIKLTAVKTPDEALAALTEGLHDIFLCDLNLGPGTDAVAVIAGARAAGFGGPIVTLTAENNPARLAAAKAAGAQYLLAKPYQQNTLLQLMAKLHQEVGAVMAPDVLYSTLVDYGDIDDLITNYIKEAKALAHKIEAAVRARDAGLARELCLNLKGSATGHGFASLGQAADDAARVLDAGNGGINSAKPKLRMLALMCGQLGIRAIAAPQAQEKLIY